jgi:hypothetical protein
MHAPHSPGRAAPPASTLLANDSTQQSTSNGQTLRRQLAFDKANPLAKKLPGSQ